jgi:transposase
MSQTPNTAIAAIGIDIGKSSFHVVGYDARGAIVLRQKWSRGQVEARLANIPPCLIGMEACVGAGSGSYVVALRPRIMSDALSAIIRVEALRLAEIIRGMIEASITRKFCRPWTRS